MAEVREWKERLVCGHAPIAFASGWRALSDVLRQGPPGAVTLREVVYQCFVEGSAAAAAGASAAVASTSWLHCRTSAEEVASELRSAVVLAPEPNLESIAAAAVVLALEMDATSALPAFVHAGRIPSQTMSRAVMQAVQDASLPSPAREPGQLFTALRPYFLAALTSSTAPEADAVALRAALLDHGGEQGAELLVSLLPEMQRSADVGEFLRKLVSAAAGDSVMKVITYALDCALESGNASCAIAVLEVGLETLHGDLGLWNLVFTTCCIVLRCCLLGRLQSTYPLLRMLARWVASSEAASTADRPTAAFAYVVALVFSAFVGATDPGGDPKRATPWNSLAAASLEAMERRPAAAPDPAKLAEVRRLVKTSCADGRLLSVLLAMLHKVRGLWSKKSSAIHAWLAEMVGLCRPSAEQVHAELPAFAALFSASLLFHASPRVRFEAGSALPTLTPSASLALMPVLLAAVERETYGATVLVLLDGLGALASDKFSAQSVTSTLVQLCTLQRTTERPGEPVPGSKDRVETLLLSCLPVLATVAAARPTQSFSALVQVTDATFVRWDGATRTERAAAAAAALIVIRARPARGTAFVPLLQKCLVSSPEPNLATTAALRALRSLCDDGVLDPAKTIKVVLKTFELSVDAVENMDPACRCAFLYLLGAAGRCPGTTKKHAATVEQILGLLRDLLRSSASNETATAAAQSLSAFDLSAVLDFVGEVEDESERHRLVEENAKCVDAWISELLQSSSRWADHSSIAELLRKVATHEWACRDRRDWSELRLLKLASASLRQSRQSEQRGRDDLVEAFLSSAKQLPVSAIRALVMGSAGLARDTASSCLAVDVLVECDLLVSGLPWPGLLYESFLEYHRSSMRAATAAVRGAFILHEEVAAPLIAAILSKLRSVHDSVLDEVNRQALHTGKAKFVGQLVEEYRKRGLLKHQLRLARDLAKADQSALQQLLRFIMEDPEVDANRFPDGEIVELLSAIVARMPRELEPVLALPSHALGYELRCRLASEPGFSLSATLWPVVQALLHEGQEHHPYARLHLVSLLDAVQRIACAHGGDDSRNLLAEVADAASHRGEWGSLITAGVAVARRRLWPACTAVDDAMLLVLE